MDGRPQKVAKKKKLRGSSSLPGLDKPAATRQNLSDGFGGSSVVQLSVKPKRDRSQTSVASNSAASAALRPVTPTWDEPAQLQAALKGSSSLPVLQPAKERGAERRSRTTFADSQAGSSAVDALAGALPQLSQAGMVVREENRQAAEAAREAMRLANFEAYKSARREHAQARASLAYGGGGAATKPSTHGGWVLPMTGGAGGAGGAGSCPHGWPSCAGTGGGGGGGSRPSKEALRGAEAAMTRAIEAVPRAEPLLLETRSCVRGRAHRYQGALDDALEAQAQQAALFREAGTRGRGHAQPQRRAASKVREARALMGLRKPSESGVAYLAALEISQCEERGSHGFNVALPVVRRDRFYWQPPLKRNRELVFDDAQAVSRARPPGAPAATLRNIKREEDDAEKAEADRRKAIADEEQREVDEAKAAAAERARLEAERAAAEAAEAASFFGAPMSMESDDDDDGGGEGDEGAPAPASSSEAHDVAGYGAAATALGAGLGGLRKQASDRVGLKGMLGKGLKASLKASLTMATGVDTVANVAVAAVAVAEAEAQQRERAREPSWLLEWRAPDDDGGDECFEYCAEVSHEDEIEHLTGGEDADGWSEWQPIHTCTIGECECERNPSEAEFRRTGVRRVEVPVRALRLMEGTTFKVRVRGRNRAGYGAPSEPQSDVTPQRGRALVAVGAPPEWRTIDLSDVLREMQKRHGHLPEAQYELTHAVWERNVQFLKLAFRYFAVLGVSKSPSKMSMDSFLHLAKECKVVSKQLTNQELQSIFQRANINRIDEDDSNDRPDNQLEHPEFVNALTRMAYERFPQLESQGLDVQMSHFVDEFLTPNVKAVLDDPLGQELGGRPCQAVLRRHYARLERVFSAYAAADKVQSPKKGSKARKEEQATINDAEWGQMLDDARLIDKMFTLREATMIFVKVNLQDELFHASDQSSFDSAMECTYDEFQLMIGRLVREKVPENGEPFEATLDTYLELILLPTLEKAAKTLKKR